MSLNLWAEWLAGGISENHTDPNTTLFKFCRPVPRLFQPLHRIALLTILPITLHNAAKLSNITSGLFGQSHT